MPGRNKLGKGPRPEMGEIFSLAGIGGLEWKSGDD